ncbi:MAG: 30S ribosomal protein S17 [Candidatus Levybacteria bacterium]|nr:30S ribosomal protein S17 [Candidatus Levybacteria bacterium]
MKIFEGIVLSVGGEKTATVEVSRRFPHPLYRKLIKRSKKYTVDTNNLEIVIGKRVKISETRPISKNKHFKIISVLEEKNIKKGSK